MTRRTGSSDGPVVVTGPGEQGRSVPNHGAGVAYAMHRAGQTDSDRTWYVRSEDIVTEVVRESDGAVVANTKRRNGHAA